MFSYAELFTAIAPVFLMIATGYALKSWGVLTPAADSCLSRSVIVVFYPALILSVVLDNPAAAHLVNFLPPPTIGFLVCATGIAIAWVGASLFRVSEGADRRTFAFSTGIFNYGYIPIPICIMLFDRETTAILLIFNIGVEVAVWTVGLLTLTGQWSRNAWRSLANPPVFALLLAIPINVTGLAPLIPSPISLTLEYFGDCAIPLGLIVIGSFLADFVKESNWLEGPKTTIAAILLRLGIIPLAMLGVGVLLPLSKELLNVLAVQAAMPCGIFMIVMSRIYGGNTGLSIKIVIFTSLFAILTIPFALQFGLWLLH